MHSTDQTEIVYVVGAGPYPYRAQGLRMSRSEAATYLERDHGMGPLEADRYLDMVTAHAVKDAGPPDVKTLFGADPTYRIHGADPIPRDQALRHLVQEWRLTPAEATHALDHAPSGLR